MDDYPILNVLWTTLIFFLWVAWLVVVFRVFADIFLSHDLGGWGKAGWTVLVLVAPFLGVLVYLLARGGGMAEREIDHARLQDERFRAYVRDASGEGRPVSHADELSKLAELKNHHEITEEEYQRAKERVLAA